MFIWPVPKVFGVYAVTSTALASGKHIQHLEVLEGWNLWKNSLEHHSNHSINMQTYAWSAWTSQLASWGSQLWTSMGRTKQCKPCFHRSYTVKLDETCAWQVPSRIWLKQWSSSSHFLLLGFLSAVKPWPWARSMVQTSTMCNFLHPSWQIYTNMRNWLRIHQKIYRYWQDQWHQWPDVDRHSY